MNPNLVKSALLLIGLFLVAGCARTQSGITPYGMLSKPIPRALRERLGIVSVVATNVPPLLEFRGPQPKSAAVAGGFTDSFSAAGATMAGGSEAVLDSQLGHAALFTEAAVVATGVAAGALAGATGTVGGLITGVSPRRTQALEASLLQVLQEKDLQQAVREETIKLFLTKSASGSSFTQEQPSPTPREMSDDHGRADIIMLMEIPQVQVMVLRGHHSPILLSVPIKVCLVRTRDGSVIYQGHAQYWGRANRMTDWSRNGSRAFREELQRCSQSLAQTVVNEMFFP